MPNKLSLMTGLLAAGLLSACSGTDELIDPPAELVIFQPALQVEKRWTQRVTGVEKQFTQLTPFQQGEMIYLADGDQTVRMIDARTGEVEWKQDYEHAFSSGVNGDGSRLFVGTTQGELLALDSRNGDVLWRTQLSAEILATPQLDGNQLVIQTNDGRVYLLRAEDGSRQWSYDTTVPPLSLRGTATPLILSDRIVAGFASGKLVALNRIDGRPLWETQVAHPSGRSELQRMVDIDGRILYQAGVLYVSTYQGRVAAIDAERGGVVWSREFSSYSGVYNDDYQLYVIDADSHVWALDFQSGATLWQHDLLHARQLGPPAITPRGVVIGDFEGYLHWLSPRDGQFLARTQVTDFDVVRDELLDWDDGEHDHFPRNYHGVITPMLVSGDWLYAINRGGVLAAYQVSSN